MYMGKHLNLATFGEATSYTFVCMCVCVCVCVCRSIGTWLAFGEASSGPDGDNGFLAPSTAEDPRPEMLLLPHSSEKSLCARKSDLSSCDFQDFACVRVEG